MATPNLFGAHHPTARPPAEAPGGTANNGRGNQKLHMVRAPFVEGTLFGVRNRQICGSPPILTQTHGYPSDFEIHRSSPVRRADLGPAGMDWPRVC